MTVHPVATAVITAITVRDARRGPASDAGAYCGVARKQ